jgi:hypothetical protein
VVPRLADASLRGHEIGELRGQVCAGLTGRVLEIGFGWEVESLKEFYLPGPAIGRPWTHVFMGVARSV